MPATAVDIKRLISSVVQDHFTFTQYLPINSILTIDCGARSVVVRCPTWQASTFYDSDEGIEGIATDGQLHYYRLTTPGTSGGSAPTWPISGTVTDGTAVWTHISAADSYASFVLGTDHRSEAWLRLLPGTNLVRVNRTGGSASSAITFTYHDGWQ